MLVHIGSYTFHSYYTETQFFTKFRYWLCSVFRVNGGWLQYHLLGLTFEFIPSRRKAWHT